MKNKKLKIIVYAICKNEEKHIKRWYESMKEADEIYVLDTGSTDNSVELLKSFNINTKVKKYKNFKFDVARNESLKMVPEDADICVCTDLDEVFTKGWRYELEKIWKPDVDRVRYNLNFTFNQKGEAIMSYFISKIHTRNNYKWTHNVHEVLEFTLDRKENLITSDKIEINHYPDRTKDRSYYLDLLKREVNENPLDDRNLHYLGREYMYNALYNEAIDTLIKHVKLDSCTYTEEKSCSMRYISRCYKELKRFDEAEMWLKKSVKLTPQVREPYVELGSLYYEQKDYIKSIDYLEKANNIKEKTLSYINEQYAWDETINDILSLDYFYIGNLTKSLENVKKALEINPFNERIAKNYELIKNLSNK